MRIEHSMSWEKRHLMGDIENPNVEKVINMWQRKSASQNHQQAMLSSMQNEDVSWCEFSSDQVEIHAGQLWITEGSNHICQKRRVLDGEN